MPPNCKIQFTDNPLGIYHAGQVLSGSVELHLEQPKTVNGFYLVVSGSAHIAWSENGSEMRERFRGTEDLLYKKTSLISQGKGPVEIPKGTHVYKFACELPKHLPTSFEGSYGQIRYTVCASLDQPWKFNQTSTVAFTVLKPVDLNLNTFVGQPQKKELKKTFCCWPCKSQPLCMTVETPVTGFVPGQKIPIIIMLNNTSYVGVNGVKCSLERKELYISETPYNKTRTVTKTVASLSTGVINDKCARLTQELQIPSIAPSGGCSVLAIEYVLNVVIQVDSCRMNPNIEIPIVIGTVPLLSMATASRPVGATSGYGSFDQSPLPTAPQGSEHLDSFLPPNYEEAVRGAMVNANDDPSAIGFQHYIPRYPVYQLESARKC